MLERHRDFSAPDNRQAIADALCSDRLQGDQRGWFSQHALARQKDIFLAGRGRYRSRVNSLDVSRSYDQVAIYDDGALKLHVYTVGELRQEITKGFVENAQWEYISDSRFKLSYRSDAFKSSFEAEIDPTSGFIHSWRNSNLDGNLLDETLQYEPMVFGDGTVCPRMRIHCEYDHGNMTLFDATLLKNATFNQLIMNEEVRVPVPNGSTIVDRRGGARQSYSAEEDYPDAIIALSLLESDRIATTPVRREAMPKPKSRGLFFFLLNILAISAIVLFVMRRSKSPQ